MLAKMLRLGGTIFSSVEGDAVMTLLMGDDTTFAFASDARDDAAGANAEQPAMDAMKRREETKAFIVRMQ